MRRAGLGAVILVASVSTGFACGTERWPVKVGTDRDAAKVEIPPEATSIAALTAIEPPAHPNRRKKSRFAPTELKVFTISGTRSVIKREKDEDYHLVIVDSANPNSSMIVEAPDPNCTLGSKFLNNIAHVRSILDQKFGNFRRLAPNLPVTVTGVAFFDILHGQEGVAPNGIELHPILDIRFQD